MHYSYIVESNKTKYLNLPITFKMRLYTKTTAKNLVPQHRKNKCV
uniref:Uncharacterized protein n=1 Tax=Anguilla anguilla TaxID=7936 RepID=A0A0E9TY14_ANGAN